ncbi:nicotinate phosphoribosyltransferase [Sulfurospirillum arcachonense]|uniref:nicotinate phosphoribosyltransferase n=1 Tax=Sulfurospirillum arcachonense TaxID=57666 RepID=UPI0004698CA1|nr:nicotinate phosphoribosyltransferase [Sulfurospirillum arcachonense]
MQKSTLSNVTDVSAWTDKYFSNTKILIEHFGDKQVTYAFFLRRPVLSAIRLAEEWIQTQAAYRSIDITIEKMHKEGEWVGSGEPLMYLSGSFAFIVELETLILQKLGSACIAAYNAYEMCQTLPQVSFLAMDARHCAGTEMAEIMAYGASVGSVAAQQNLGAVGFIGNATDATAHFFGKEKGLGTVPHAFIGYAGSTLKAAQMFHECFPEENLPILADYFGCEITDTLEVCDAFSDLAKQGKISVRLDTHGGRFLEGLDTQKSYQVLERHAPDVMLEYRTKTQLHDLIGMGVSAAALWSMREALDNAGFPKVRIIASSGFSAQKCLSMACAKAPIDIIGTGSFLPERWSETYATADIIAYDNKPMVKVGREFLFKKHAKSVV